MDIDLSAVEIAKLRLWLSLIVDDDLPAPQGTTRQAGDIKQIKPLPNLDYKIMQGNSLIELLSGESLFSSTDYERTEIINKLKKAKDDLFNATSTSQKSIKRQEIETLKRKLFEYDKTKRVEKLRRKISSIKSQYKLFRDKREEKKEEQQINDIKREIEKTLNIAIPSPQDHFEWHINFSEVFQEKKGFDVVIANPPYVSVKEISSQDKKTFGQLFETGKGRFNLFTLFLEKGRKLLRPDGVLTYILPEGLYSNVEYRFIREYLLNHSVILFVNLFSSRVFEAAVDTSVISLANRQRVSNLFPVIRDLKNSSFELSQEELNQLPFAIFPVSLTQKSKPIIDKLISNNLDNLEKILEIQQGIIYSGLPKYKVFSNVQVNKTYKKILDGRDVLKWKINWEEKRENRFIHYSDKLHRPREERIFLVKEKILLPRKATRILAAYDDQQYYALNTAYLCLPKNDKFNIKFVLACLNSKLINYFYSSLFFGWQITIPALNLIPIPIQNTSGQKPFIDLVDKILAISKDSDYLKNPTKQAKVKEYEHQIDQMVYKLYGLTDEEIKIVEGFVRKG